MISANAQRNKGRWTFLLPKGRRKALAVILMGFLSLMLLGCAGETSFTEPTLQTSDRPTEILPEQPPSEPPTTTSSSNAQPEQANATSGVTVILASGSVARYRVQEQLARLDLPNDAVGETSAVTGTIVLDAQGSVVSDSSMVTVDLRSLESDEDRRDNYLRDRSLESNRFPMAEFVIRETPGLEWPLPTEGENLEFQLVGDMTLHGVTRPFTWDVNATFEPDAINGTAVTNFTFDEFDMDMPRVSVVLSVDNNIRLELDFVADVDRR